MRPGVLIIGHGSSRSAGAFASAEGHAARLRATGRFGTVATGFLRGGTPPREALDAMPDGEIFIVPFLMSEGYFSRVRIPDDLGLAGRVTEAAGRRLVYCDPVGTDPALATVAVEVALGQCRALGCAPAETEVLVVGHGSPNDPGSRRATLEQAGRLERSGRFRSISCAFLDETPTLPERLAGIPHAGPPVVLVGLFAADGLHAGLDIPEMVADWHRKAGRKAGRRRCLAYAGAVGSRPAVTDLLLAAIERGGMA